MEIRLDAHAFAQRIDGTDIIPRIHHRHAEVVVHGVEQCVVAVIGNPDAVEVDDGAGLAGGAERLRGIDQVDDRQLARNGAVDRVIVEIGRGSQSDGLAHYGVL